MAITAPIPLPESGADAFQSGATTSQGIINSLMQNKLVPAQIQEAQGKAAQSQMMANLINSAMSGGKMGTNNGMLLAGLLGIPTQTQVIDGQLVQTNPISGTSTQQIGETPEQKAQLAIQQANAEAAGKSKVDTATDLESQASDMRGLHSDLTGMNKLLTDNPGLGGFGSGLAVRMGLNNDPNAGEFQSLAGSAQTRLAKMASSRGGIGVLNWTKSVKPDIGNRHDYNMGLVGSSLKQTEAKYKDMDKQYYDLTGKHLPDIKSQEAQADEGQGSTNRVPKTTANGMVILYKNGKEYHLPPKLMNEALTSGGFTLGD